MEGKITAPHMTPIERQLYEAGHTEECRGFIIKPKRDFGRYGYWSAEHRCNLNAGWVIVHGSGLFAGALATPGCTFSWTLKGAREMVDDMIAAGYSGECNSVDGGGDSDVFWQLNRERHQAAA